MGFGSPLRARPEQWPHGLRPASLGSAMQQANVTYRGPALDDRDILARLPASLASLLEQINGFVLLRGGLHLRGACCAPSWHSLRFAWEGSAAFCSLYPSVLPTDVPFAEDCLGDQFLLRGEVVHLLACETGELESLDLRLRDFLQAAQDDPLEVLGLQPLQRFIAENGRGLEPGELLAAYPPYCFKEAADGVHIAAIPAEERRRFLAHLAQELNELPEGATLTFKAVD